MRWRSQASSSRATGAHASRRQTAQSGSIPRSSHGTHTSSASASTRSASAPMSFGETNGMSQATMATSGSRAAASELAMPRMAPADPSRSATTRGTRPPNACSSRYASSLGRDVVTTNSPATGANRPSTRSMSGSPQNNIRALSEPMRDDSPPAWTTQERSARLTVVIRQNTPIGMLETRCAKLNTAAEIAALRKARAKTKQRLCGTQ